MCIRKVAGILLFGGAVVMTINGGSFVEVMVCLILADRYLTS